MQRGTVPRILVGAYRRSVAYMVRRIPQGLAIRVKALRCRVYTDLVGEMLLVSRSSRNSRHAHTMFAARLPHHTHASASRVEGLGSRF
eukprot:633221-Rhodomonas_salina.1